MIVKRYIVDDMNEAMIKIRYDLGNEAIIISQKKIRQKGIKGFFKKKRIEVTAAVDDRVKKNVNAKKEEPKSNIDNEISEIKEMMKEVLAKKKPGRKKVDESVKLIENTKEKLKNSDFSDELIDDVVKKVMKKAESEKRKPDISDIENTIKKYIKVQDNLDGRIQVLIGPTGVGKTTTIAKLASVYSLYKNKKVGLITLDTYRIGAVEQLKTYAEILSVPFDVILSIKDIPKVMEKMKDRDIIFIDTTGRNSKNIMQISEIRKFIEEIKPDKIHLVLSMTTKQNDLKKIINNYKLINYDNLILTKVDETDVYGSILSSIFYSNVPVSYIAAGQNVPEDIEEATFDKLYKLILEAERNGSGR